MSWTMVKEVRKARFDGVLKRLTPTQFFVLLLLADTCRDESRVAKIGIQELLTLTGYQSRNAMSRCLTQLEDSGSIKQLTRGNQHQTASYEILTAARDSSVTSNTSAGDCTTTSKNGLHVTTRTPHVTVQSPHVCAVVRR